MFFSVVIPTYNRSAFIKETVESVLNQTYTQFEILIVDDGSTDNTGEIIKSVNDTRLNYFFISNGERGRARNFGFNQAKGDYVIFFDSDDIMLPNHLEVLNAKIKQAKYPNFIAAKFNLNRNGQIYDSDLVNIKEGFYSIELFLKGNLLACNFGVKKANSALKLFEENRAFAVLEDWMFLLQNLENDQIFIVDQITITMSDHDQRSMRADNHKLILKLQSMMDWLKLNTTLSADQLNLIAGQILYLSAIHAYMDNDRSSVIKFLIKSSKAGHLSFKYFLLLIKALIGINIINKLK
ncbi:glycosyltransferase family 2 protein [Adhaeribacter terreus]|uniref:Glycosyltransferase family 2 protein n=1 Tax=Adhaeribacter terreus TaxID=529703 RepID=A0ABW0E637_9BACT